MKVWQARSIPEAELGRVGIVEWEVATGRAWGGGQAGHVPPSWGWSSPSRPPLSFASPVSCAGTELEVSITIQNAA